MSNTQSNHSRQSVTPLINSFVDGLLVVIILADWKPECDTRSAAVNGVQVRAVDDDDDDDDDDGRINFNVAYSPKTARTRNS